MGKVRETKRGRPVTDNSRNRRCDVRMSDEEFASLDELSTITGKNKSDVIREALRMYSNLVIYQR